MLNRSRYAPIAALLLLLAPLAAHAEVVINEVDYDQPGTDTREFIELYNNGPGAANLGDYTLELVNGVGGAIYLTVPLPQVAIAQGGCFVICGNRDSVTFCHLAVTPSVNLIQNGPPDAIGLRHNGVLVDALSYEGSVPGYTETNGTVVADDNVTANLGLTRTPDGDDTNDNVADFSLQATSPAAGCQLPVPAAESVGQVIMALLLASTAMLVVRSHSRRPEARAETVSR